MATIVRTATNGYTTVQDEGTALTPRPALNFIGAGVTAVDNAGGTRTDVTIPGGAGAGYSTIAEEGSSLTQRTLLNFVGRTVTAVDNAGGTRTDVTVLDTVPAHSVGNSGTALTLDAAATAGPVKLVTLNGNCTFTFSSVTTGREVWMVLVLTQDATGSRTVTWPVGKKTPGGVDPVLTTTAGGVDRFLVTTYNNWSTYYLDTIGKGYA